MKVGFIGLGIMGKPMSKKKYKSKFAMIEKAGKCRENLCSPVF